MSKDLQWSELFDVAIIGGGICGLMAASILRQNPAKTIVLEKSKGVGGRLASRRVATSDGRNAQFDHGGQFLEIRDKKTWEIIRPLLPERFEREWHWREFVRPLPAINSFPKLFAASKDVCREKKVETIVANPSAKIWNLQLTTGETIAAKKIISTAPLPQLLEIIENSELILENKVHKALKAISYNRSIAVMIVLNASPGSLLMKEPDPAIEWLIDNVNKGISKKAPSLTIIASSTWAATHFQSSDQEIFESLWDLADLKDLSVESYQIHRWKYAIATSSINQAFAVLNFTNIPVHNSFFAAGEAFGQVHHSPIERAIVSGYAVAQHIANQIAEGRNELA